MTTCQTIAIDFNNEMKSTRKLLELAPLDDAHRNFQPHAKSMPLDRLATHVAELPGWIKMAVETEVFELQPGFKPLIAGSTAELLEIFDNKVAESQAAIASTSDEDMKKTWSFKFAGQVAFSGPRTEVVRSFINHLIHHRAQLGVYLRLNEIPIPGMYGPSADDGWPPKAQAV